MSTSVEIRRALIDALRLDLVGPEPDDEANATELLPQAPSRWYLTGFLVPREAPEEQRRDDSIRSAGTQPRRRTSRAPRSTQRG